MTIKYSKTTGGFYSDDVHGIDIPDDAEVITQEEYESLLATPVSITPIDPGPNAQGFITDIKSAIGGVVPLNNLLREYPAFTEALKMAEWQDVHDLIVDAETTGAIDATQYASFKTALSANNIPVVLP